MSEADIKDAKRDVEIARIAYGDAVTDLRNAKQRFNDWLMNEYDIQRNNEDYIELNSHFDKAKSLVDEAKTEFKEREAKLEKLKEKLKELQKQATATEKEISKPIEFGLKDTRSGVPNMFRTFRTSTVEKFFQLIFPNAGPYMPFVFIRAPPLSGKTGLLQLLYNRILKAFTRIEVIYAVASEVPKDQLFSDYFCNRFQKTLSDFIDKRTDDRVLLIDEAQVTYNDEVLWLSHFKSVLERNVIQGIRIVVFSSYGSFDVYRKVHRSGTPFVIPGSNTFGLSCNDSKPCLRLLREELDEMIGHSVFKIASDLIWELCSSHIGIAQAILCFLDGKFGNKLQEHVEVADIESELRSVGLLDDIRKHRGIPNLQHIERIATNYGADEKFKSRMVEILDSITSGRILQVDHQTLKVDKSFVTPEELLAKHGFVLEDFNNQLQFASQMHLKVWLHSTRNDPILPLICNVNSDDFLIACIKRMNASRLQQFADENSNDVRRERQIQMELYNATVSYLPKEVLVTPEWRTTDGKGFIDLVIRGNNILWIWELLVNGDDASNHAKRFESVGKYYPTLTLNFKYVLIDFRQDKGVKKQRTDFIYVSFTDSFKRAKVFGKERSEISVDLLHE